MPFGIVWPIPSSVKFLWNLRKFRGEYSRSDARPEWAKLGLCQPFETLKTKTTQRATRKTKAKNNQQKDTLGFCMLVFCLFFFLAMLCYFDFCLFFVPPSFLFLILLTAFLLFFFPACFFVCYFLMGLFPDLSQIWFLE